jgi:hypothetical protein
VRKFLMNWKTLLVVASLTLSTGLTACSSKEGAETPKTETTAPAATTETKPATEAPKSDAKPADGAKSDAKPADGMKAPEAAGKTDATKTDAKPADGAKGDAMKPGAKPAETKKP